MLRQRVITALLLGLPILALLFYAPATWILLLLALILLVGAWEWSGFLQTKNLAVRIAYTSFIGGLLCIAALKPALFDVRTMLLLAVLWWSLALCWIVFAPQSGNRLVTALSGILVLLPMWFALTTLRLHYEFGAQLILCVILLVISTDIGGYFFGKAFGRHKLAPRVSPGKTWEGVAGGVLSSMIIAALAAYWFKFQLLSFVALAFVTVSFSIVGDLTESLFKRHAGLKDSGNILPGHGGVLDRIDSLTAASPVFVLGLLLLHMVTL